MTRWKLKTIRYVSESSNISDNIGQIPLSPKYLKTYENTDTGEYKVNTDLDSKKYKRMKVFRLFLEKYLKYYEKSSISIFSAVVDIRHFPSISKFINSFTRKLKRKNIERLGYVWQRDIGDIKFDKHFHVLIATSRIDKKEFHKLFSRKRNSNFKIQFMKTRKGMFNYLKKKGLFGGKKLRAYAKSRFFRLPKLIQTN